MTPAQAATAVDRFGKALQRELRAAEAKTLREAAQMAQTLSSGPFSRQQLAAMGYPYARRDPHSDDPEVINEQTGAFRADWTQVRGAWAADTLTNTLRNDNGVADFLDQGTAHMIRRPIVQTIEERIEPVRRANLLQAIANAEK